MAGDTRGSKVLVGKTFDTGDSHELYGHVPVCARTGPVEARDAVQAVSYCQGVVLKNETPWI